jgi:alpha-1,2-mannosyltransferase
LPTNLIDRFLTPDRIRNYSLILVAFYVLGGLLWIGTMVHDVDRVGKPIGYDFITFYGASYLAGHGQPALAYNIPAIFAAEQAAVPANPSVFLWHYPPPFELIIAPLAMVPYKTALALWLGGTLTLYVLLVRKLSDHPWAILIGLAFPAVFINAMHGQNGFLNAAILGFGLLWLDKRPWLAGALLGLMVYKPHFGVLLPFLLLAQGRWKSIAAAAASGVTLCIASFAAYGAAPWLAFVKNLRVVSEVLEDRFLPWHKIPSVFVAVADLGVPLKAAYAIHALVALALGVLTVWAWRRPGPQNLKLALAVPAMLAVSPYCFDYDLVLLAIPIGILADYSLRSAAPAGTKSLLLLAFICPIIFTSLAEHTHLHLMPVAILSLFYAIWRVLFPKRASEAVPFSEVRQAV